MAKVEMTPIKSNVNEITEIALETATAAEDGFVFTLPKASDEYLVVIVTNTGSAAHDVTLKAPTKGSYAASSADVVHNLAAGASALIRIESAKYANTDGTVCIVPEDVTVKAAVLY